MAKETAPAVLGNVMVPDLAWVAKVSEPALEPDLPIVDPHHHLWQRTGNDYLFHDLLADTQTGHNIVGTVFVDCHSMYRKDGPAFREGFAELAKRDLTFDAWLYHPQLGEIAELADAFPGTPIILDHVGGPLGYAGYAGRHDEVRAAWKKSMMELAKRQNIVVKVGGLGMAMGWFDFYQRPTPPGSQALADAFKPWVETCIDLFGVDRCMFESNFPVDKITSGYGVLWNAFKRLAAKASAAEKTALFSGTASRVYKLA